MRGRRSEWRVGRCPNEPATPAPLRNDEGYLCRDSTSEERGVSGYSPYLVDSEGFIKLCGLRK